MGDHVLGRITPSNTRLGIPKGIGHLDLNPGNIHRLAKCV